MKIHLKKGLDIRLAGAVKDSGVVEASPLVCAIVPDDYYGFSAKVDVKEGDAVRIGTPIIHDKNYPQIIIPSPISGRVKAVVRGERRKLICVEIESDGMLESLPIEPAKDESVIDLLCRTGLFAQIRRRPYDVVARPDIRPRDIFVTAMDTAPLAVSPALLLEKLDHGRDRLTDYLASALKALGTLTDGKVYLSVGEDWPYGNIEGAETVIVSGPHPAGNPGIQIANIAPVNKGDEVWTLDVVTLYKIGLLLSAHVLDTSVILAITGPEVKEPCLLATRQGAAIAPMLDARIDGAAHNIRVISGNVLSGIAVNPADGFIRFPWRQITVMAEGDDVDEFMGWASMSRSKLSFNKAIPFRRRGLYSPDSRLNGGVRAMIMSGEYDRVMPADIMVEYLLKSIISRNIEEMEALGIYEVAPEDLALCEFVDTSKLPVQQIVRDGLDFLRKELE